MTAVAPEKTKVDVAAKPAAPTTILSPFDEVERLLEAITPGGWFRPFPFERPALLREFVPRTDIIERDDEVVIRAELPGVDKKDVDVSVNEQAITIKASTKREEKEEKGDYYRCEIARGGYRRTVALPTHVDPSKAKATMKDGLLEVILPMAEEAKRQSIKVD